MTINSVRESSWIINRGLIGSFYRSLWYLVQIFISDLSSETLGPACEPVIKAASDLLTKSGVGIYLHIYNLYTVYSQNFFFSNRNGIYVQDSIKRSNFHFFSLNNEIYIYMYPNERKLKNEDR